ncbi:MAG TPA: hypothetical protein VMT77_09185 [Gemmatimonadales bacterium]|nr:hypothetical protein [Gemmatimonadales bacterium]
MSLIDRFAAGLETLGKKANQALDEGKLRVELSRVRRRMDAAARDLGYLTYRQAKGTAAAPGDVEGLTRRIAEGEEAAGRIEAQIAEVKRRGAPGAPSGDGHAAPPSGEGPAAPPPGERQTGA